MATNAEAIASALARTGVEHAFGLPGGEIVLLMDACRRAGIRFFLTGHEASAAFMADVTGQITGRPGVCMSTLGPGAMNLGLGLANAFLDRSPVIALTASIATAIERHFSHQRLPLTHIFGGFCKASVAVDGRGTAALAERCIEVATTPPWGPVHIALPSDLAAKEAAPGPAPAGLTVPGVPPATGAGAGMGGSGAALDEIGAMLREATRPLLMVGVGCLPRDVPALRRFVDRTGMPFVVTPKAKGALPEDAPGFLGVISGMAIDKQVMENVDQADVLLGAGFDPVECDKAWYVGRRIANLSRASTAEGDYHPTEHVGDIGQGLDALAGGAPKVAWPETLLKECRARISPDPIRGDRGLSPLEAVGAMREALPRETVLTCDVGSHKYYAGQFWRSHEPHTFFMSNGLSAMGYGIPAAIAARLQFPQRPVVAMIGDGGMLMMSHNLVFLRQYQVPVVVVVFTDESLSLIRVGQKRRGLNPYGVDFPAPDFQRIAEGFGVRGTRADSIPALRRALEEAVRRGEPAVITVPVDHREYEAYC